MLMNKAFHIAELITNDNYIHACIDITVDPVHVHQHIFVAAVDRGDLSQDGVVLFGYCVDPKLNVVGQNHRIWRTVNNHIFQAAIGDAFNHGSEFSYLS